MGLGPSKNGKYAPITPWQGSWAEQQSKFCCLCGSFGHRANNCGWTKDKDTTKLTADIPDGMTVTGRVDTKSNPRNE